MIKKITSEGNESYHKTSTKEDLPQPPRHSVRTPTKNNFNKTSDVESRTQADFIYINIPYHYTLRMIFLKLSRGIIWGIKGMLMTFFSP